MNTPWIIKLNPESSFVTEVTFFGEDEAPIILTGFGIRFVVSHEGGEVVWSTASGHVVLKNQTTDRGEAVLTVPKVEIADLPFEWSSFELYLDSPTGDGELVYHGKVQKL